MIALVLVAISVLVSIPVHASELRFNQIRAIGTHNSFHEETFTSGFHPSWSYTHLSLTEQLDNGVRQLELDVHLKDDGRFYVHHVSVLDQGTSCKLLQDCLREIHAWTVKNPNHFPLMIWVEIKDKDCDRYLKQWVRIPPKFSELDQTILAQFSRDRLLVPADLAHGLTNLPLALRTYGWPKVDDLRGRVVFGMIGWPEDYDKYFGSPVTFQDKIFFANVRTDYQSPLAAFIKLVNPFVYGDLIRKLVREGFIVTTTSDSPENSDHDNFKQANAAFKTGAQYVSTNFLFPGSKRYVTVTEPGPRSQPRRILSERKYGIFVLKQIYEINR